MKIAPSVETLTAGFPNKEHQIDTISGKPEQLGMDILFTAITENAAFITTLKGGGCFGHMALCMPAKQYATIPHTQPFVMEVPPPGELTFVPSDTAAAREDTKLLYYNKVYNFELKKNVTTALMNIIKDKLDESTYIRLKQQYVGYVRRSVWEFINHLIITFEKN